MRVTLYEPALAVNGKAYAGWANRGDELFFPHVDSCCALIIVGDKAAVGGHMGAQLPNAAAPNHRAAGRYVWELVLANHLRLNTEGADCTVITIGESNWYDGVVSDIWLAARPDVVLPLRVTAKFCQHGADVLVMMDEIRIMPCQTNHTFILPMPTENQETKDIGP